MLLQDVYSSFAHSSFVIPLMPAKNLIALACLLILLAACARAPQPMPPAAPAASSALALSPNGSRLAAVNPDSDSITLVDANAHTVIAEVMVGDNPATAAFTPDGADLRGLHTAVSRTHHLVVQ